MCDAVGALAHSQASPWTALRERLSEAIASRQVRAVAGAARRGWREAGADAARTSRHAPDPELARAIAVAYAIIAEAPSVTVTGRHAERNGAVKHAARWPFWR